MFSTCVVIFLFVQNLKSSVHLLLNSYLNTSVTLLLLYLFFSFLEYLLHVVARSEMC